LPDIVRAMGGSFASETYAGAHPAVLGAVAAASRRGELAPYGEDPLTLALREQMRERFGADTETLLTFTGTSANLVALGALLAPHDAVVCPESAHVHQDECGAFERLLGRKLLVVPSEDGKLAPDALERRLGRSGLTQAPQPRVVSISQCTELGTCYAPDELRALADVAHAHGLLVHADGARLANAAAFLGTDLRGASRDCGVDALSLGLTKIGGLCADAVLLFGAPVVQELRYLQKQLLQVASKMRFLAAQALALLEDDLWRTTAGHANAMARRLAEQVADVPGVQIARPVEANSVFARVDPAACARLRKRFHY
jgi:threonine aldolase